MLVGAMAAELKRLKVPSGNHGVNTGVPKVDQKYQTSTKQVRKVPNKYNKYNKKRYLAQTLAAEKYQKCTWPKQLAAGKYKKSTRRDSWPTTSGMKITTGPGALPIVVTRAGRRGTFGVLFA